MAEARAQNADLETVRADLRLEVTRVYWALATATQSVTVLERSLARADAHVRDVRSRFEAGLLPPNEVLRVEAERSRQEVQLIEARNLVAGIALDLGRLTGVPAGAPIQLSEVLDVDRPGSAAGRQAAAPEIATALEQRPEWRALTSRVTGAQEREDAAAAGHRPSITLTGGVDYARPNTRIFPITPDWRTSWDLGVTVTWTAWDSGRTRAEAGEAAAGVAGARDRLAEFETLAATELQ